MIVVDASVVMAALLPEADSNAARSLLADEACVAPDLIVNECANALWRSVRVGRITASEASQALAVMTRIGLTLTSSRSLADRALELALAMEHPAYDCFYLALAEMRGIRLATLDHGFVRKLAQSGVSSAEVKPLSDIVS